MSELSAPTIDAVNVLSASSVSVAFTHNYDNKLFDVSYTIKSSPGDLIGTGTSSPIIVSDLESNTSYSFTITATTYERTVTSSNPIEVTTIPSAPIIDTVHYCG